MHELSIAENISGIISDSLAESGADRVVSVHLEIGCLSGIETDALRFALSVCLKDSPAGSAEIVFHETPGKGKCESCGAESPMPDLFSPCAKCGSHRLDVVAGQELKILKLEVVQD